ncbi:septal ring lytic transglycosylase RlpA family protein [Alkalicaulis satelles]|uniref:septal ring lytic transglycosylase RlpA family protein n=1 Tax=Alkalicaulis satelles TaxID=2609175 RepID=UPI0022B91DEF|nr:septal ring lytic transglycosylase RlpA family protein [Alkalicaulis satelles]
MRLSAALLSASILPVCLLTACAGAPVEAPLDTVRAGPPPARTPAPAPGADRVKVEGDWLAVRGVEEGTASWYGPGFHGRLTANGEIFDQDALSAAHLTLDLPSLARVTRLDTGDSVIVRVNDRGPYIDGRIIDLSRAAAEALDFVEEGLAEVRIEVLGPADREDRAAVSRIVRGPGARVSAQR